MQDCITIETVNSNISQVTSLRGFALTAQYNHKCKRRGAGGLQLPQFGRNPLHFGQFLLKEI